MCLADSAQIVLFGLPPLIALSVFLTHTQVLGRPLEASTAFASLAVFVMIASPLDNFAGQSTPII